MGRKKEGSTVEFRQTKVSRITNYKIIGKANMTGRSRCIAGKMLNEGEMIGKIAISIMRGKCQEN